MPDQTCDTAVVQVVRPQGPSGLVLVCEHASCDFPGAWGTLGLPPDMQRGHAAWDPGARPVAQGLSDALDAPLVLGGVSRLIYDCNRPPQAASAILQASEGRDVPGNIGLSEAQRADRVARVYVPFEAAVRETMRRVSARVLITVHSFTPVFEGAYRAVEIGILHDSDTRLADAMLGLGGDHTSLQVARNAPYGPQDGVTHTLQLHGLDRGILNVMLELRNDLIATPADQNKMAQMLAGWITASLNRLAAAA